MASLFGIGTQALFASYSALHTTGHNIANANTPGYSRQKVELATAGGQGSGAGFFGMGVRVTTVSRDYDQFLTADAVLSKAIAASDSQRLAKLQQLEQVFGIGELSLGYASGQFLNSFVDVASKPGDAASRQVALSRAQEVATKFNAAAEQLDQLQAGMTQDMKVAISAVNSLAAQVASINGKIAFQQSGGQIPNDLMDQRDKLVSEISQYLQVNTLPGENGTQNIFIGGGQQLVLGTSSLELTAMADKFDPTLVRVGMKDASGSAQYISESNIIGGSIAGLLKVQNEDLPQARNLIGQLAAAFAGAVNAQHALGMDFKQPAGLGAPIFSVGAPQVLPANTNARGADGNFLASIADASGAMVSTVALTVTNASELMPSDYALRVDPSAGAGSYQLTRLSDGTVTTVVTGDVVDGFRIDIGSPEPGPTDRYLLRPVGIAARDMARVLDDPKGIAAASPVTAGLGQNNTGTASVASLNAVSATLDTSRTASITFTSDTGDFDWEMVDSTGAVVDSGTDTWSADSPISLNGWELRLNGVPKSGDTLTVAKTTYTASSNGNALTMSNLVDRRIVGQQTLADGTVIPGDTVTDAYAKAMAEVGMQVQASKFSAQMAASVAAESDLRLANKVGVNLDEEAARLMQYQQGYQAAARILQVAQAVFDSLLRVTDG